MFSLPTSIFEIEVEPEWIGAVIFDPYETHTGGVKSDREIELDLPLNVYAAQQALKSLVERVLVSIEGKGGNNRMYETFCILRDNGVSEDKALELFAEHYNPHCLPPWSEGEMEITAGSAYKYAKSTAGVWAADDPAEVFADLAAKFEAEHAPPTKLPPLTIAEWQARELREPDWLLGNVLSTTTRAMLFAPTGVGKTMLCMAMAMALADGKPFLHWSGQRACKVLYIDGEMSSRLDRERIRDAVRRQGSAPEGFYFLCTADLEGFAPLNTELGQKQIEALIETIGGFDFIFFDNVMSLTSGNQREEETWTATQPWVRSLTTRGIGQLWVHHTGHDAAHSYGTKTREWQMDLVGGLFPVERPDANVSFKLSFEAPHGKARERTPTTREDFREVDIALVDDHWAYRGPQGNPDAGKGKITDDDKAWLVELKNVEAARQGDDVRVPLNDWRDALIKKGLLDITKPHSMRTIFPRRKERLIARNWIATDQYGEFAWTL